MNPTKILLGNNLVSTLVMPLSTLPQVASSNVTGDKGEERRPSGSVRGDGHLITIKVQSPDDEDQEDSPRDKEEEDICRISVTQ